jgi:Ni/Fe-hydrogenase subunit HybB-like protein
MIEKALSGSRGYWLWLAALTAVVALGAGLFVNQLQQGLGVTGMGRDTPWGIYITQTAFMVGIAASAVMVVLPYYLHDYKAFGAITLLGEFVAIPAVIVSGLFIVVDLGRPDRLVNLFLHPSPRSPIFWDAVALTGYLLLNLVIAWTAMRSHVQRVPPPRWIRPLIYLSIPWAVTIHTFTAFLFSGLAARPFWMTAILAPRFLASAFASGPALLILLVLLLERLGPVRVPQAALQKLAQIATYALLINLFFLGMEVFTVFYSGMPHHQLAFEYLYIGVHGKTRLVPFAWSSLALCLAAITILLIPRLRHQTRWLAAACGMIIVGLWIDKGFCLVLAGYVPTPLDKIVQYTPTAVELLLSLSIYALGALLFTVLAKLYLYVRAHQLREAGVALDHDH